MDRIVGASAYRGWLNGVLIRQWWHAWTSTSRTRPVHSTPLALHLHNSVIIQEVSNGNNYLALVLSLASCVHSVHFLSSHSTMLLVTILVNPSVMPRERGKPKRGPAYYIFVARHRWLSSSSSPPSPHTSLVSHSSPSAMPSPSSAHNWLDEGPPMAYIEEEIPAKSPRLPPFTLCPTSKPLPTPLDNPPLISNLLWRWNLV
jgi:hypothetical protein